MPGRPSLALLAGSGLVVWGAAACSPPDVPPVLGASVVEWVQGAPDPAPALEAEAVVDPGATSLTALLARAAPDTATARRTLEHLERAMGDWREASDPADLIDAAWRVDRALEALPTLEDWRPLIRAELLAKAGDTTGVRTALEQVDPESGFLERWGWRFGVEALEEAGDLARARSAAEAVALGDAQAAMATLAWFRSGELALAAGDTAAALERLGWALAAGPGNTSARSAALRLADLPRPPDRDQDLAIARALVTAGEWRKAADGLTTLLRDGEGPEVVQARIRLDLGRALFELRRFTPARETLAPLMGDAVPAEFAAPALYWTGRAALAAGNVSGAETAFLRLARRAPESPLAEQGLLLLINREGVMPPTPRSLELLEELFALEAPGAAGELAAIRIGTGKYLRGDYDQAAVTFTRFLEGSPRTLTRQQATYWSALVHERRGDREGARALLEQVHVLSPLTFYGVFAGERIGAPVLAEGIGPGPAPTAGMDRELANALIRLRVHRLVPTPGSFALELDRLNAHFLARGDEAYDFAEAMIHGGLAIHGIVLGRDLQRREGEWNLRLLRIVHPFPYRDEVIQESRRKGLDPFFVAGLIRQESMFDARISSPAGAVGLMQLMPATAQQVARSEGIRYSREGLEDPRTNIRLGTNFLATLVNRFDGRAEDALSAYNAGPTRIRQWRQRPEYGDRDVFMEHIPFAETRNYVKLVQQYARIYTALYGCGDFQPCLGDSYPEVLARSLTAGGAPTTTAVAR
jgi:soluble lytic murein transglycosylase